LFVGGRVGGGGGRGRVGKEAKMKQFSKMALGQVRCL
jgi:hypothetical protein